MPIPEIVEIVGVAVTRPVTYRSGRGCAVAIGDLVVLSPGDRGEHRWFGAMFDGTIEAGLAALRSAVAELDHVAIVERGDHHGAVVARGSVRVEIGGDRRPVSADRTTVVAPGDAVRLVVGPAGADVAIDSEPGWPLLGGVVAADSVVVGAVPAVSPGVDELELLLGDTAVRSVEGAAVRPSPAPARPLGVLVFSSGERVVVDRPVVIGRHPDADGLLAADGAPPRLVRLRSRAVSRRHAEVRIDRWRLLVDDLGSANGTVVELPGGRVERVEPGCPVVLAAGARVDLGGEVSFEVEEVR